jgi:hypothetical protein
VQGSHGRHETNGSVVVELFAAPLSKVRNVTEYLDGCVGYNMVLLSEGQVVGA